MSRPMHECAAWVLASALGPPYDQLVPTTVLRDIPPDGLGSLQIEASGQREPNPPFTSAPAAVATAGFFDCLIGQQDRHPGNVRWRIPDLELIDHGFAFAKPGDRCNGSVFLGYRLSSGPATLSAKEQQALQTLSASADLLSVRPLLEANRVTALEGRIQRMLTSGNLLAAGDF